MKRSEMRSVYPGFRSSLKVGNPGSMVEKGVGSYERMGKGVRI